MDDELKSDWKYKSPTELGYVQFRLTKKQHNELFPNRKHTWKTRFEYYYNDDRVLLYRFTSGIVKFFVFFGYPLFLLVHGIANYRQITREYKELFNEKKYGSYLSDTVRNKSEKYDEIMKVVYGVGEL